MHKNIEKKIKILFDIDIVVLRCYIKYNKIVSNIRYPIGENKGGRK